MEFPVKTKLLSTWQVVLRVVLIVILSEYCIMMIIESTPDLHGEPMQEVLTDIVLLGLISTPMIYFWVVRPFVQVRDRVLAEVDQQANTDGLTGLANRRDFDRRLVEEHARHARSGADLALVMMDLDFFKAYNDLYGHLGGDDCLRRVAALIAASAARPGDLAARYGGEEFVCILPNTDLSGAVAIAERMRVGIAGLKIPHAGSGVGAHVTASFGVASLHCGRDSDPLTLIAEADRMVYQAKARGRNQVASTA